MSAFPNSVNYSQLPRKALGSRVSKIQIAPRNSSTFSPGNQIQIQLPTMANSYINLGNCYLKMKIKRVGGACHLDHTAYSLFNRITTSSQSAVLDDLTEAGCLYSSLLDLGMGSASLRDWGKVCLGSDGAPDQSHLGHALDDTNATGVALPFFTGIFNSDKLLPLDTADGVVFTFYLESALNSLIATAHNTLPTGYIIEDVNLHAYIYTLSPESQALLDASVGDMGYSQIYEAVSHSSDSKTTGELTKISTLGFRYSSLSKVLITHRASDNQGDAEQLSISNRSHAKITEYGLLLGGLPVPERPITSDPTAGVQDFSEPLSETLLSFGVLGDKFSQLGLNGNAVVHTSADATDPSFSTTINRYAVEDGHLADDKDYADVKQHVHVNMGSFVCAVDTDLVKNAVGGESTNLYSGVDTLGMTVQAKMRYAAACSRAQVIDYYAFYNSILSLNPISRSWEVSN